MRFFTENKKLNLFFYREVICCNFLYRRIKMSTYVLQKVLTSIWQQKSEQSVRTVRKTKKRGRIASSNHNWSDAPLYITFDGFSLFLLTLGHFCPNDLRIGINKVEKEPKRAWIGTKKDRPTPPFTDEIAKQYLKASHIVVLFCSFMLFPVNFYFFLSW